MTFGGFLLTPGEISLAVSGVALLGVIINAGVSAHQFKMTQKRLHDQEANALIQQIAALVTHSSERNQRIGQRMLEKLDWAAVPESLQAYLKALMSAVADPVIKSAQATGGDVDFVLPPGDCGGQNGGTPGEVK